MKTALIHSMMSVSLLTVPVMAKAATATRASMDDLGSVAIALKDNLKVGEEGFEGALNMLAYAGKRGQFEKVWVAVHVPENCPHPDGVAQSYYQSNKVVAHRSRAQSYYPSPQTGNSQWLIRVRVQLVPCL